MRDRKPTAYMAKRDFSCTIELSGDAEPRAPIGQLSTERALTGAGTGRPSWDDLP
jgi:hypothetical protein